MAAQGAAPDNAQISTYLPSAHELSRLTHVGSYLAARHAGTNRDAGAAAAYYRASLRGDPKNTELLERAFLSVLAEGDVEEAVRLADQVVKLDKNDRIARLVIGVHALKQKKYAVAKQNLTQSIRGPITDLAATLLAAWASYGAGDAKTAIELIDKLQGADWYALFKDLHAGLILDLAGNKKEAGKRFDRAQKLDATALRLVESYGSWLSRNGKKDEALKVFKAFDAQLPRHPLIVDEMATSKRTSNCRCWSRMRRLALPKCSTGSAPRSAAAAAKIWGSSICSSRSISRPISRWRCCRSPISTSR